MNVWAGPIFKPVAVWHYVYGSADSARFSQLRNRILRNRRETIAGKKEHNLAESTMISVLAQERLLGAALGSASTAVIIFENRRSIYRTVSENNAKFDNHPQVKKPIFETKSHFKIAHWWNKAVDRTFGTVIASLSSRGW